MVHGFCKYKEKGCAFRLDVDTSETNLTARNHLMDNLTHQTSTMDLSDQGSMSSMGGTTMDSKKRYNVAASQVFLPGGVVPTGAATASSRAFKSLKSSNSSSKFSGMLSPNFSDIQSFVPQHDSEDSRFDPTTPSFEPSSTPLHLPASPQRPNPYLVSNEPPINPYAQQSMDHVPTMSSFPSMAPPQQDFMYPPQPQSNYPLNYHLYAPSLSQHLHLHLKGNEQTSDMLFIPNKLRESLTKKNQATLQTMPHSQLPSLVGVYFNLVPLNGNLKRSTVTYGYPNSLYKATSNTNGRAYTLRRIENVSIGKDRSISTIHSWIKLRHSNVAQAVDAFTTRAFGDNSLIVVYDFYPEAKTLYEQHIHSDIEKPEPVTMETLWSYICQIAAGLAAVHSRNLAVRSLSLQKVIITSKHRIRLSDCGVFDILDYVESFDKNALQQLQEMDLSQFGEMMISLAHKMLLRDPRSLPLSRENVLQRIKEADSHMGIALHYLSNSDEPLIDEFQKLICTRLFKELDRVENSADFLESQLSRELENGRLVRLMSKINFLIDRPEYEQSKLWHPTGERYPVKLFFQYLYHQSNHGKPSLDLAHVLINLNKLDAGIEERILLVAPDEQTCLIVSYKEIKDLVEKSFRELTSSSM